MRGLLYFAAIALLPCAALAAGGDSKKDLEAFQGNWSILSIKSAGDAPPVEVFKDSVVVVKSDEMKVTDKGQTIMAFKVKLDAAKKPSEIDFFYTEGPDKGKTELGLYKFENDTLTLCTDDFGGVRPTEFATKAGSKTQLIVLKRAK